MTFIYWFHEGIDGCLSTKMINISQVCVIRPGMTPSQFYLEFVFPSAFHERVFFLDRSAMWLSYHKMQKNIARGWRKETGPAPTPPDHHHKT
jgi:hypothetical protein